MWRFRTDDSTTKRAWHEFVVFCLKKFRACVFRINGAISGKKKRKLRLTKCTSISFSTEEKAKECNNSFPTYLGTFSNHWKQRERKTFSHALIYFPARTFFDLRESITLNEASCFLDRVNIWQNMYYFLLWNKIFSLFLMLSSLSQERHYLSKIFIRTITLDTLWIGFSCLKQYSF